MKTISTKINILLQIPLLIFWTSSSNLLAAKQPKKPNYQYAINSNFGFLGLDSILRVGFSVSKNSNIAIYSGFAYTAGKYAESYISDAGMMITIPVTTKFNMLLGAGGGIVYTKPLEDYTGKAVSNAIFSQIAKIEYIAIRDMTLFAEARFHALPINRRILTFPEINFGVKIVL